MNQRFQFLNFTAGAGKLTVQAPANANLAPPGDYMLFLVDTNGVPSVGSFIRCPSRRHDAADTTPPTVVDDGAGQRRARVWRAVTDRPANAPDNDPPSAGVPVQARRPEPGAEDTTSPYSIAWDTSARRTGTHYYTVDRARGRRRQRRPASNERDRDGSNAAPPRASSPPTASTRAAARRPPTNPAAATTARCRTRPGRRLRASSATRSRSTARTRSSALPDSTSLDLTTAMTLEAWVRPTALGTLAHGRRSRSSPATTPTASTRTPATNRPSGNGDDRRLDRDSRRHAPARRSTRGRIWRRRTTATCSCSTSTAPRSRRSLATGSITTSTGPLKIGGNAIWGEWFSGLIDEVRRLQPGADARPRSRRT